MRRELTAYLADSTETFDVIVSADTLVYFRPARRRSSRPPRERLRPGGRLIFTVEELVGAEHDAGHSLDSSGRYRHSREYVQAVLKERLSAGHRPGGAPSRGRRTALRVWWCKARRLASAQLIPPTNGG